MIGNNHILKYTINYNKNTQIIMDFHKEELMKSCRVCGRRLRSSKGNGRAFECSKYHQELLKTFSVDITNDNSDIHPPQFCFSCYGVIRRKAAADNKGLPYITPAIKNQYSWHEHKEGNCNVRCHKTYLIYSYKIDDIDLSALHHCNSRRWTKPETRENFW